jgi:hypothetical protein
MHRVGVAPIRNQLLRMQLLYAVSNFLDRLAAPVQNGNSDIQAHFTTSIKCDSSISVAFNAHKLRAASMDIPVAQYGMPTLTRASQRGVARPEQASQRLALRQGATCQSVQRRGAEAGAATNRTSVSRHMTLSARREAEDGVATTSSPTTRHATRSAVWPHDALHTYSRKPGHKLHIRVFVYMLCHFDNWYVTCACVLFECIHKNPSNAGVRHGTPRMATQVPIYTCCPMPTNLGHLAA